MRPRPRRTSAHGTEAHPPAQVTMHTYRKRGEGWEVGFQHSNSFDALGPRFGVECEAAAFASFLNGGRYNPDEIEALFPEPALEDDASIHPIARRRSTTTIRSSASEG